MRQAYVVDKRGSGKLAVVPRPVPGPGEALIRVTQAGICNTDLELLKGYMVSSRLVLLARVR
jgi:threonine dehydrogenase-like Zn-dependent dehydrogenase